MKAIIFGANGQDGYYLTQLLQQKGIIIIGVSRKNDLQTADITSYKDVADLITKNQPQYIFHLAANSTTQHQALFENHSVICTGTLNILEAVRVFSPHTKVFISGSGLQFINNNKPIKETDAFESRDAYSVSRIHSVYAARYFRRLGIQVYVGYFFNHDSPKRTERHIAKKISAAAKRIAEGSNEKLEIGEISVIKEWTFAGDIVRGIWTLVNQNEITEANISSGIGYSIEDWLQMCFGIINKNWRDFAMEKKDFTPEYKQLVSDPSVIFSLGWKPEVSFEELARMMLR
jgi:GDPmannose 4,6-dehydratase